MSFEEDEVLYVYDQDTDPNWWKAKCNNREGLIPANYGMWNIFCFAIKLENNILLIFFFYAIPVEEQTQEVELPLHEAARRGNISFLRECLKGGVSGTGLDSAGNTPLYWAAKAGHVDCVKELLSLPNPAIDAQVCEFE